MGKTLQHAEMGARLPSLACCDCHLLTVAGITSNWGIYAPPFKSNISINECNITLHHLMPFHLVDERGLTASVPGYNEQSGGIPVQAVNDTRAQVSLRMVGIGVTCQQRVDQGVLIVARCRMHDHA